VGDVVVRPIALTDIGSYAECVAEVIAERDYLAWQERFPIDETARFVAHNIRVGNPQFVADDDGRIVGWCDIMRSTVPVHLHCGSLGMGMLAPYRERGLGTRLIIAALSAAREVGIERVDLVVYARNTRAAALYRKVGFRDVGKRTRGKKLGDKYDDELLMEFVFERATS
jgi:ribosomal protein S18 acetylase RimI-like enzyme